MELGSRLEAGPDHGHFQRAWRRQGPGGDGTRGARPVGAHQVGFDQRVETPRLLSVL